MTNVSRQRQSRLWQTLFCVVVGPIGGYVALVRNSDDAYFIIMQTIFILGCIFRDRKMVREGLEKVSSVGKTLLNAIPVVLLATGVVAVYGMFSGIRNDDTGGSHPIPLIYYLIQSAAGLAYIYVLYEERKLAIREERNAEQNAEETT